MLCSKPAVSQAVAHSLQTITNTTLLHSCSFHFLRHFMSGRQLSTFLTTSVCELSYNTWQTVNMMACTRLRLCYRISGSTQHASSVMQWLHIPLVDPYHYSRCLESLLGGTGRQQPVCYGFRHLSKPGCLPNPPITFPLHFYPCPEKIVQCHMVEYYLQWSEHGDTQECV